MKVFFDPILGKLRRNDLKEAIAYFNSMGIYALIEVANYSALPDPTTVHHHMYVALASQGTSWLPGSWGGNYYPEGYYYSDGTQWIYAKTPYQASQVAVDAGLIDNQFVTPLTLKNAAQWGTKEDITNKSTSVTTDQASNIKYPSVKSVYDWITTNYQPKKFSYTDTVLGTATSGTGNQFSKSVLIPANTLTSGALNIKGRATKIGASSYGWLNIYVNSANNLTGAKHIGQINTAGYNTVANLSIDRTIPIQVGSFVAFIINTNTGFEEVANNTQIGTQTIDWTVDQYVILSCQSNGGADTLIANFLSVNQF